VKASNPEEDTVMVEEKKPLVEEGDKTADYKKFKAGQRGHKPNRRGRRNFRKDAPTRGGNDFAFWNEYPELMNIATRLPWMHIAGTPLEATGVNVNFSNVAVQHYFSIPGTSEFATDPLNLVFRQIYLDMHRKYRGVGTYQACDIGIAMICIESVLQLIIEAERVYGILKGYPIKSRIEPEGLLRAMGYSSTFLTDVKANLANFRYGINRLIELAKRLPLPAGMSFFKNHVALNGFVYKDSEDPRASLLVFVCDNYYHYTTVGDSDCINNAGSAQSVTFSRGTISSYDTFLSLIETELTTLLTDSDILRITSDFISCYGENNMQVLMPLPEDYNVVPEYSKSILHKWHNSERYNVGPASGNFIGYGAIGATTQTQGGEFAVYQYDSGGNQMTDIIVSMPFICGSGASQWAVFNTAGPGRFALGNAVSDLAYKSQECDNRSHILDSWEAEPGEELICESMLWKRSLVYYMHSSGGITYYFNRIKMCCTEILCELKVYAISNSTVVNTLDYEDSWLFYSSANFSDGLCNFDWAPLMFDKVSPTDATINQIVGDTDNVTTVEESTIAKVLDAANLSAFKVSISGGGSDR
jgi:hypothetical protein